MTDIEKLEELPIWSGPPEIQPCAWGRTNSNFIIIDRAKQYFARIGRELPHHFIDRTAEAKCGRIAAENGIGPEMYHAEDGVLVMALMQGRPLKLGDGTDSGMLVEIAALLRRLHAISIDPAIPELSPVQASLRYLNLLDDEALPEPRGRIGTKLASLKSGKPSCIVHGDLIPENFLLSEDRLYLVDWEYAGIGFPEVDLALTIANFELDKKNTELLLDAYGDVDLSLLSDMRVAAIIREALWCVAQRRFGSVSEDLAAYTALCNQRLRSVLE
jgi:thiamine kinase-like enzyme